jgi:hypothetical protein
MTWSTGGFSNGVNFTIVWQTVSQIIPVCVVCGATATRYVKNEHLCEQCLSKKRLDESIQHAQQWLPLVFASVSKDRRADLYKKLSLVYHPDVCGDDRMMKELNNFRDKLIQMKEF